MYCKVLIRGCGQTCVGMYYIQITVLCCIFTVNYLNSDYVIVKLESTVSMGAQYSCFLSGVMVFCSFVGCSSNAQGTRPRPSVPCTLLYEAG